MIRVYIASPYTIGDRQENVNKSFEVAGQLIDLGFAPFPPLFSHYIHEMKPRMYETWMALDYEWLNLCHCVLRLPGESKGADLEEKFARRQGKPVFYSIEELQKYIEEDHTW